MRWKCIEINNSYVIILMNTAHCINVLKLNAKQKALSISSWTCHVRFGIWVNSLFLIEPFTTVNMPLLRQV